MGVTMRVVADIFGVEVDVALRRVESGFCSVRSLWSLVFSCAASFLSRRHLCRRWWCPCRHRCRCCRSVFTSYNRNYFTIEHHTT